MGQLQVVTFFRSKFDSTSEISFAEEILPTPVLSRPDRLKADHLKEQIMLNNHGRANHLMGDD